MKKLLILFVFGIFALCSCGDDVTEINGYTEEELSMYLDSIMQEPETTFVYSKDTIIVTKKDTTILNKKDTVVKVTKDTIVKLDTIVKFDTTVVKEIIENNNTITYYPEEEKPRDTILVFYDTTENKITQINYEGFVYNNVFYQKKEYKFGILVLPQQTASSREFYHVQMNTSVQVYDYNYRPNCGGACWEYGYVYLTDRCGVITDPDYNDIGWKNYSDIKRINGWRMVNETESYISPFLNKIATDSSLIYLSIVNFDKRNLIFEANIIKYKTQTLVSNNIDKEKLTYLCAYDL